MRFRAWLPPSPVLSCPHALHRPAPRTPRVPPPQPRRWTAATRTTPRCVSSSCATSWPSAALSAWAASRSRTLCGAARRRSTWSCSCARRAGIATRRPQPASRQPPLSPRSRNSFDFNRSAVAPPSSWHGPNELTENDGRSSVAVCDLGVPEKRVRAALALAFGAPWLRLRVQPPRARHRAVFVAFLGERFLIFARRMVCGRGPPPVPVSGPRKARQFAARGHHACADQRGAPGRRLPGIEAAQLWYTTSRRRFPLGPLQGPLIGGGGGAGAWPRGRTGRGPGLSLVTDTDLGPRQHGRRVG